MEQKHNNEPQPIGHTSAAIAANPVLSAVNVGDDVFEIHCVDNMLYVNTRTVSKISKKGKIICGFEPFNGLKFGAINQFNRQYRCWDIRGNHLNMFRCYSLKGHLNKNLELFHKKFKKITGYSLPNVVFNSR